MANIHELADYAAARDIMVGIEIHGDITSSAKKAVPIIKKIKRKNVRINYDTANVEFYGGTTAEKDLEYALPYLIHCHLKDHIGGAKEWRKGARTWTIFPAGELVACRVNSPIPIAIGIALVTLSAASG